MCVVVFDDVSSFVVAPATQLEVVAWADRVREEYRSWPGRSELRPWPSRWSRDPGGVVLELVVPLFVVWVFRVVIDQRTPQA